MSQTLLAVRDAHKSYGPIHALRGASFEVGAGEVVALLGPNGAGKSTLLRCLTTLLRPDSGHFELCGTDVAANPAAARAHFGYAGQEGSLDKLLTGAEMLRFQAGLSHLSKADMLARSAELLGRFGLAEAAHRPVEGYSGGMKRRLDLACALLHRPRVLILDEPSSGLDYEARRSLWALLGELRREGVAILLATHDFEEAELLATRCVLLAQGRVAGSGSPAALREALGEWVISAALHEHPHAGDRELLSDIFAAAPGTVLPPRPGGSEFAKAVPAAAGATPWLDRIRAEAARRGLELSALGQRRPTLQDAYLAATSGAEAV
jgi:ABC-2 type transport system ATP-binding protein